MNNRMRLVVFLMCASLSSSAHADSIFGFAYLGGDVRSYDGRIEAKGGAGMAHGGSLQPGGGFVSSAQ